jgi:hypothetical protein
MSGPVDFTCAEIRAEELRAGLILAISHSMAIEVQAQAALLSGHPALALETLRGHWTVMRAEVAPIAGELTRLLDEEPAA